MNKLRFLMPVGLLIVLAGFGIGIMLLWNWLMPAIFGLMEINFWQALGILVLCRILFGGFNFRHHRKHNGEMFGRHHNLREKWQKMTPEQRTEFVQRRMSHFDKGSFFKRPEYDYFTTDNNTKKDCE